MKMVRWFSEPVLVIGSFLVTLGVIAVLNGGSLRAAATLSDEGEPALRRSAHDVSDRRSDAPATGPALGIIFDDAWLLLIAGFGALCMGKGLRLIADPSAGPSLRSA